MAHLSELDILEARRRALVAESELHRQQIAVEVEHLRAATAWVERAMSAARSVLAAWPVLAPVAGFVIARKGRSLLRTVGKGWSWWRIGRRLAGLWLRR